jgi:hypothetical protein
LHAGALSLVRGAAKDMGVPYLKGEVTGFDASRDRIYILRLAGGIK